MTLVKRQLNVTGDGVRGWDLETGLSSSQQLLEFSILDDTGGLVAFSDPFHKVSAIIKIRVGNMELSESHRYSLDFHIGM